ncbi:ML domain-domain-containing protein [Syncephalastrum racemosum]|uniref:Phosphatidylglycerol/phosphatidylinositol transfer protein n=1 Tax=Syncephalastrum racemosum TaxID=13706 RepID=A0A1X2HQK0_SYNRA|nr:ML domain-domain-containing protein [Syncephalastrum racemosum]
MFLRLSVFYAILAVILGAQVAQAIPIWFPSSLSACFHRFWSPSPDSNVLIQECGGQENILQINSITLKPAKLEPGKELVIKASGTLSETIEEGAYADVVVKVGVITILRKEFELCEEARKNDVEVQCPVGPGFVEVTHTVTLPKEIPPARYSVSVDAYTVDDDTLSCLTARVDFRRHPFGRISRYFAKQEEKSYLLD